MSKLHNPNGIDGQGEKIKPGLDYLKLLQRMDMLQSLAALELIGTGISMYGHSITPFIITSAGAALIVLTELNADIP